MKQIGPFYINEKVDDPKGWLRDVGKELLQWVKKEHKGASFKVGWDQMGEYGLQVFARSGIIDYYYEVWFDDPKTRRGQLGLFDEVQLKHYNVGSSNPHEYTAYSPAKENEVIKRFRYLPSNRYWKSKKK